MSRWVGSSTLCPSQISELSVDVESKQKELQSVQEEKSALDQQLRSLVRRPVHVHPDYALLVLALAPGEYAVTSSLSDGSEHETCKKCKKQKQNKQITSTIIRLGQRKFSCPSEQLMSLSSRARSWTRPRRRTGGQRRQHKVNQHKALLLPSHV